MTTQSRGKGACLGVRSLIALSTLLTLSADAADWAQLRGPNFNGTTSESVSTQWPSTGPKVIWKRPLRAGFSSFVVQGKSLCTLVLRPSGGATNEAVLCVDPET